MRIPSAYVSAGSATTTANSATDHGLFGILKESGGYTENWSSLIGIVTAIVGNVLISFALNMQRYAHIRLDREWQEKERQRKRRVASSTSISKLADAVGKNGNHTGFHTPRHSEESNGHTRAADDDDFNASESDPLIPSSPRSRGHHFSDRVDSTIQHEEQASEQKSYLKSPYWWLGIILMTIGEAGNFLAYGFAPASIVSPLGVVALISNCIIAPFMLKERFRKRDALGVVIAVGGAVTVVLSANDNNPKLGPDEIWDLIRRWEFETYLGITVGVIALLMVASNKYGDKNILIDLGLVGLFGGYTALSTKGVSSLLSYTLWRVITFPVFYLLVAILAGTAVMQIKYVNRALQRFSATQVIPVQFVLFTLSVIGGSAVLYRDFERTSGADAGKFIGGCALTFFGVWLITSGRKHDDDDDESEDREPETEDAIILAEDRYRDDIDTEGTDGLVNFSRRSSKGRSTSPLKKNSPRFYDDDSRPTTPNIRITHDPSMADPNSDRPATADLLSSLIKNPWMPEGDLEGRRTPPFGRHTSTPVLPSEAAPPPLASASNLELVEPRTPTRGKSYNEAPATPGSQLRRLRTSERVATMSRNSIAGPLLASPLSTTLSAMVQDMKRGGNIRQRDADGSIRRRESVLGIGAEEIDDTASFGDPLSRRQTQASVAPSEQQQQPPTPSRRGRSLSGTLGDLWRGVRGNSSREDADADEEARQTGAEEESRPQR